MNARQRRTARRIKKRVVAVPRTLEGYLLGKPPAVADALLGPERAEKMRVGQPLTLQSFINQP